MRLVDMVPPGQINNISEIIYFYYGDVKMLVGEMTDRIII